ncbi:hypothetical protein SAMN04489798_3022 [Pseudomonas arsenicoxydans]|uniref:Uncharacterized protein n=1 Tax=Pseudomonas arsenicoxydans TaxID=702115 RepID=A0A1H0JSM9_9PSED|nr:hypothetical protein [Pseudomonas arsenicoxydans]SDO46549.1 hypothetical protein SAMN04489798_3022 [Pseudomonas arsenicoxydans]
MCSSAGMFRCESVTGRLNDSFRFKARLGCSALIDKYQLNQFRRAHSSNDLQHNQRARYISWRGVSGIVVSFVNGMAVDNKGTASINDLDAREAEEKLQPE